jgi:PAS domain S-box-containing protein
MSLPDQDALPKADAEISAVPVEVFSEQAKGALPLTGVFAFALSPQLAGVVLSDAFKQRLGLTMEGVTSVETLLQKVHPQDRARVAARLAGHFAAQEEFDVPLRILVADGSERPFVMHGFNISAATVSGVFIEAEHKASKDEQGPRHARETSDHSLGFAAFADAMPQMVWSTLPDGFHDYYNAGWYEFTGMPRGSTDGEGWSGMFHPDDQPLAWKRWKNSLSSGEPYEIEYRLRHHSGEYRWVLGRALAVRDSSGDIIRWLGTCTDINDTKKASEYVGLLSQELSHRIKNIFAIIQSLIGLSARRAPASADFARDLQGRVAALGRAHDLARPHSDQSRPLVGGVTLHHLTREILRPYLAMDDGRITISGEDMSVDDAAATPFALILHELATNSKKYGALSAAGGKVAIFSSLDETQCRLIWTEADGPSIAAEPAMSGFGTKLMLASAQSHLNGQIEWRWATTGLVVSLSCPRSSLRRNTLA